MMKEVIKYCVVVMLIVITITSALFFIVLTICAANIVVDKANMRSEKISMSEYNILNDKYISLTDEHNLLLEELEECDKLKDCVNSIKTELCNAGISRFCEFTTMRVTAYDENMQSCKPLYGGEFCKTMKNAAMIDMYMYKVKHIQVDADDYQH